MTKPMELHTEKKQARDAKVLQAMLDIKNLPREIVNKQSNRNGREQELIDAARTGNATELKRLIDIGTNIKCTDDGWDALGIAAYNNYSDCLKLLIEAGADVNFCGERNYMPAIYTALRGHFDCLRLLINSGAYIEARGKYSRSLLSICVDNGYVDCANFLIQSGADIEAIDEYLDTPTIIAARGGHADCLKLLIDAGANIYYSGISGNAMDMALENGHSECVILLQKAINGDFDGYSENQKNTSFYYLSRKVDILSERIDMAIKLLSKIVPKNKNGDADNTDLEL